MYSYSYTNSKYSAQAVVGSIVPQVQKAKESGDEHDALLSVWPKLCSVHFPINSAKDLHNVTARNELLFEESINS